MTSQATTSVIVSLILIGGGTVSAFNLGNRVESGARRRLAAGHPLDRVWPWSREAAKAPEERLRLEVRRFRRLGGVLALFGLVGLVMTLAGHY